MRPGEVDGQTYNFVSRDTFAGYVRDEKLLEHGEHNGNFYGTMKLDQHEMKRVGAAFHCVWRNLI
jgi:guanylate kinase